MKTRFRIKEKNGNFYPQKKQGFLTIWTWETMTRPQSEQYPNALNLKEGEWVHAFFKTLKEAQDFIEDYKKKTKVVFHNYE